VWPDNDEPGRRAGEQVCSELRKVGVSSLHLVNFDALKKQFPEKWDLADSLPEGMSEQLPKKLIAKAVLKCINPEQAILGLGLNPKDPFVRQRINEILWRVDDRMRPTLEEKYGGQSWKIQDEILKETQKLYLGMGKQKDVMKDKFDLDSKALDHLCYQASLVQAYKGREPRIHEVDVLKETIHKHGFTGLSKETGKNINDVVADRLLAKACEKALEGINARSTTKMRPQHDLVPSSEQFMQTSIEKNSTIKPKQYDYGK
jgi:hypothetical protein